MRGGLCNECLPLTFPHFIHTAQTSDHAMNKNAGTAMNYENELMDLKKRHLDLINRNVQRDDECRDAQAAAARWRTQFDCERTLRRQWRDLAKHICANLVPASEAPETQRLIDALGVGQPPCPACGVSVSARN